MNLSCASGGQLEGSPGFPPVGFGGAWVICSHMGHLLGLSGLVELETDVPHCRRKEELGKWKARSSFDGACSSRVMLAGFCNVSASPGVFPWSPQLQQGFNSCTELSPFPDCLQRTVTPHHVPWLLWVLFLWLLTFLFLCESRLPPLSHTLSHAEASTCSLSISFFVLVFSIS